MVRHTKKHKKLRRSKRRSRGGGYSDNPSKFVSPGNVIHQSYAGDYPHDGPKDCTGNSQSYRPGYLFNYSAKGLPGLSGGGKRNRRNKRGGSQLGVAPIGDYGFFIANNSYVKPDAKVKKVWSIKDKIIENYLYHNCQRAPGYRVTINELFKDFENLF